MLCDLYLKRFDLTKGLLFDTFFITVWYKLCRCTHTNCVVVITEYWSSNHLHHKFINWKLNAPQNDSEEDFLKKIFLGKCAAGQIFDEIKCTAGKTYQTKCAAGLIFDYILMGSLSY